MARQKSKASYRRDLIDSAIKSAQSRIEQEQKAAQEAAKAQIPDYAKGMTLDDVNRIIDSYNSQNSIPKLEQNTTPTAPTTTAPSIADELERMKKAKADTTTPRTEGEQRAIDTYYNSLMEASGKAPKQNTPSVDYKAEIDRMNALKADTSAQRTEGENKAIDTYLAGLTEAQRYLDSQKPKTTSTSVKKTTTTTTKKTDAKKSEVPKKNIGTVEISADGTKRYTKTMSPNEQRDYERALMAQSKARGRALSAPEQRDYDRAQEAIARAKEREKVTTQTESKVMPTAAKENKEELQFGQLSQQKPKATPTPTNMATGYANYLAQTGNEEALNNYVGDVKNAYDIKVANEQAAQQEAIDKAIADYQSKHQYDDRGFLTNESIVNQYIDPSKKLTKDEKKQAKNLVDTYLEYNPKAKELHDTNNANYATKIRSEMTPEERDYYAKMVTLENKLHGGTSAALGVENSIPALSIGMDELSKYMGVPEETNFSNTVANAKRQNPLLEGAGEFAGKAVQYGMVNNGPLGNIGGQGRLWNLARGQIADTLLDTAPNTAYDIYQGKYTNPDGSFDGTKLIEDVAANQAINAAFNLGAEYLPTDAITDRLKRLWPFKKKAGNTDIPRIDAAEEPNLIEMATKNADIEDAVKAQDQAVENIENLRNQIKAQDNINNAKRSTENTGLSVVDNDLGKQADEAFKRDIEHDQDLYRKLMNNEITYEEFAENVVDPEIKQFARQNVPAASTPGAEVNVDHNKKLSRFAPNTVRRGTNLTNEEYAKNINLADMLFDSKDEERSVMDALDMIRTEGPDGLVKRLVTDNPDRLSQSEIDALMALTRTNNATARAMEAMGEDASALRKETNAIYKKLREQSSSNAQGLQALAKWTRNNTPEGMLMYAENFVNGNVEVKGSKLQEMLKKLAKRNKSFDFSPEFEAQFMEEANKLFAISDMNSREAKDIMARLGRMVNEQIPVKLPEKVQAYLMDNMLGNFRTLITRNAGGNLGLNAVEQTMTRPLAAGLDWLLSLKTGKRTQAGLSREALADYITGFGKGLADEAHDLKTGLHTARTGENTIENAIKSNRHVFKSKIMDMRDSLIKNGLSVGDRPFYEATYKQTLGDYYRLREKGVMGDIVQNLSDEDFKLYAETAANLNALAAVYQDDTLLSKGLMGIKTGIGELSEGTLGFDILSQFTMPFVKTPANVVSRAIDYSPLGAVRNTFRTGKELANGVFDQNRFVNETARNIIGTGLMAGAAGLAKNGVISGSNSDKSNVRNIQKTSGMQEYAFNVPEWSPVYGGQQIDIGWIPVVGSNAVAAASAYEAFKNGEGDFLGDVGKGAKAGANALFDQSMFQGLQRLFGTGESYDTDSSIGQNLLNVVHSGAGQAIPSLARQVAQVMDPYQRDIYNSNPDWHFGTMKNSDINNLINNIPVLRQMLLAPKVDANGDLVRENQGRGLLSKINEDMILPGKITEVNISPLDQEAMRLETLTGEDGAYRPKAGRIDKNPDEVSYDERGFELAPPERMSNDEYVAYEQKLQKEVTDMGNAIVNSDFYKSLNPTEQEDVLDKVYKGVKNAVISEYNGKDLTGYGETYANAKRAAGKQYDEKGFEISPNAEAIQAVLDQVEAKNNPYGLKEDNYNKYKESGEDLTRFAGFKQSLAQTGLTDGKDTESAWLGEKIDGYYFGKGKEGVNNLAEYKKYTNMLEMSDSKEAKEAFIRSGKQGLMDLQNARQTAIDTGFVTKDGKANVDAYDAAYSVLGSESAAQDYAQFATNMQNKDIGKAAKNYLPELEKMNLTDEQKGQYAYIYGGAPKEGSSAEEVFKAKGYKGYYQYRLLQNPKDYNNNGKKDKGDRIKTLYSWGYNDKSPEYKYYIESGLNY